MNISVKRILLFDGFGAFITAGMCLLVAHFEKYIGMPKPIMFILSGIALCFALFSICSFLFVKRDTNKPLSFIIIANTAYCCITLVLVFNYFQKLTALGVAYFIGEILVVMVLVCFEYRILKSVPMVFTNSSFKK